MLVAFDPNKDRLNQQKHGLSLQVAEGFTEAAWVVPTYPGSDTVRFKMIEDLPGYGVLVAIVTPRPHAMRVISLRRPSRTEARIYAEALRNA